MSIKFELTQKKKDPKKRHGIDFYMGYADRKEEMASVGVKIKE